MEALPRALRLHHDVVGEGGLSPYHILCGRDRLIPGIPYTPHRECEDAQAFFTRMESIDQQVAEALRQARTHKEKTREDKTPEREVYSQGSLVWVLKPLTMSAQSKLEAKWKGPYQILSRNGKRSYLVGDKKEAIFWFMWTS